MYRALGPLIASICLAACSARTPELPRVSLKDEQPAKITFNAVSRFVALKPVVVTGADQQTNTALALAMFHALNLSGVPVNTEGANWQVSAVIEPGQTSTAVVWVLTDESGNRRGEVRHEAASNVDIKSSANSIARAALAGLVRLIPYRNRAASLPPQETVT